MFQLCSLRCIMVFRWINNRPKVKLKNIEIYTVTIKICLAEYHKLLNRILDRP